MLRNATCSRGDTEKKIIIIIKLNQQGFGLLVSLMFFHLMTPFLIVLSYHKQHVNNFIIHDTAK